MVQPNVTKTYQCIRCGRTLSEASFTKTHSVFYPGGRVPICNSCLNDYLSKQGYSWDALDKVCQWADIPFIVKEWQKIVDMNGEAAAWPIYSRIFQSQEYEHFGWDYYHKQYLAIREANLMEEEIPLLKEEKMKKLRRTWGGNYDDDQLLYLEDLYNGLKSTQTINGALQIDQARKLCKLSLEIDNKIAAADKDVDKFLSSYEKTVKIADFTPKSVKNANDFDNASEIFMWLEKRGRMNRFYDGVTRDVIDETIKTIENWNQKLYINEGGIGDDITQRIEALKYAEKSGDDDLYGLQQDFDLDAFDNDMYGEEEDEEFLIDLDSGVL